MKPVFQVPVSFLFAGTFEVSADTQEQAEEIVRDHCAMTSGTGPHSSHSDVTDWEVSIHPVRKVVGEGAKVETVGERVIALLSLPLVHVENKAVQLAGDTAEAQEDTMSELSALIQKAAILRAYLTARGYAYNSFHTSAAQYANKALIRVRKALGCSYPEQTSVHIP